MSTIEDIDFKVLALLNAEQAHAFRVIPAHLENGIATFFAGETEKVNETRLQFFLGKKIELHRVPDKYFVKFLGRYYPISGVRTSTQQTHLADESDVVRFVRKIMEEGVQMDCSDIHIERYESFARVRFRWEGQLIEKYEIPGPQYNALISRIKILSELDIAEKRLPQDGRIHLKTGDKNIDIRVSVMPTRFGEKIVMRLLHRSESFLNLANLGMQPTELSRYLTGIKHSNGIILITGPTGSGKTSTLYATLNRLNKPDVNISTVEDPVEYNLEGINQVQVHESIGLDFSRVLRAFLRQDPNIIMVGEIRDQETAEIAVRIALAGRLVFSTLHTNSAWDAIGRLIDLGLEPYLLAATIRMLVAQRLLRELCPACRKPSSSMDYPKVQVAFGLETHFVPEGCSACHYTGYAGRVAVYEVIPIDKVLSQRIKTMELDIEPTLNEMDIKLLKAQVLVLLLSGKTSLEEGIQYLL